MDRMIFTAMTGAKQVMLRQANNNHNLANVSTTGFQRDLDVFQAMPLYGAGHLSRVYTEDRRAGIDFTPGSIQQTGRELDVAINGDGFIAVQTDDGLAEAYTRAGDLRVNAAGLLETRSGQLVLGEGGIIAIPPFEKLDIGTDGTISIRPVGQAASTLAAVDRIKLVNPDKAELQKRPDGLLEMISGEVQPPDANVTLTAGALEASNVNPIDALVTMIELARQFEMQIKLMEKADATDQASATLLRLPQ